MHDTLDFRRLGLLIRTHWTENIRFYLLAAGALLGLMVLVFSIWVFGSGPHASFHEDQSWIIYLVGLFLTGAIFASTGFGQLADKSKGIYWLSIPASHLEKLITTALFTIVFFFVVYSGCFLLVKTMVFSWIESTAKHVIVPLDWEKEGSDLKEMALYFFLVFVGLQTLFMLGSIYFNRFSFIKTIISAAVFIFLFVYVMYLIHHDMYGVNISWQLWEVVDYNAEGGTRVYNLPAIVKEATLFLLKYAWAPVFLVITWFRLKEKEI